MNNAHTRALVCFQSSELQFRCGNRNAAAALYLEGLRILNQESDSIRPLPFLELCAIELRILTQHMVPWSSEVENGTV